MFVLVQQRVIRVGRLIQQVRAVVFLLLLWRAEALAFPDGLAAGSRGFELRLEGPPECSSTTAIEAAVEASVHTPPAEPLKVSAQIAQEGELWMVNVSWEGGQRRVQGDSCAGVTQALVAIIALALDPTAQLSVVSEVTSREAGPSPELVPPSTPQPEPERGASPAVVEPSPASHDVLTKGAERGLADGQLELGGSLLGQAEAGLLPAASYGAALIARGSLRPWSMELGGSWLRPQWAQVAESTERKGGYVSWMTLQANLCRAFGGSVAACAGAEVGELRGKGEGVTEKDIGRSLWLAAALTAVGRLALGHGVSAEVRAVGAFPLYRPEFHIEPYAPVHTPSWGSARLLVGIGFQ